MHRFRFSLFIASFTAVTAASVFGASTSNNQDADSQLWSETRLVYKINDKFDIFTAGSYRLTHDFSNFQRVAARAGGTWQATPAFSISPSYYYLVDEPWTRNPRPQTRICLLTAYDIPVETAKLTLSNTTEYRMPEYGTDGFWLRPKLRIEHPVGPGKWGLVAFAADELFYQNDRGVFTQDQVFCGFEEKFNDRLTASLYYVRRIQMNSTVSNANGICLDFKITFGQKSSTPTEPSFR